MTSDIGGPSRNWDPYTGNALTGVAKRDSFLFPELLTPLLGLCWI